MPQVGRVTDLCVGVCCCHKGCKGMSGIIITGSDNVILENLNVARIGDIVLGFCGHTGILVTGSETVTVNNSPEVRVGDLHVGCFIGNVVTGSPSTYADGL